MVSGEGGELTVEYIAAGCNQVPHCLAWSATSGLAYYGAARAVCVYRVAAARVERTLVGHKAGTVNCLACVPGAGKDWVVSGSTDGSLAVWAEQGRELQLLAAPAPHTRPVTALATLWCDGAGLLVASAAADHSIVVTRVSAAGEVKEVGQLELGAGLAISLHLATLPSLAAPLLLAGRDDCKVHLWSVGEEGGLEWAGALAGHENWVAALASRQAGPAALHIASAGQDGLVRLWCLEAGRGAERGAGRGSY